MSLRAIQTLQGVDVIACEDTRVSRTLLAHFGIATPSIAYHDHNAERARPEILARLGAGGAVALISDAGMPLVSDPGYKLVRAAVEAGHTVTVVPGASAPLAALALSGLPTDRFLFAGFLPPKSAARRRAIAELAAVPATLILFESGPRLAACMRDLCDVLGDRPAAVARELTKLHEETRRASLSALAAQYAEQGAPRGEIVVVIAPPAPPEPARESEIDQALRAALTHASPSAAAALIAQRLGLKRRDVYARALALGQNHDGGDNGQGGGAR
jgi:16S rRNA (cytidine1402-2'-O)-methyltransferase